MPILEPYYSIAKRQRIRFLAMAGSLTPRARPQFGSLGRGYAFCHSLLLTILLIDNIVRLCAAPYAIVLVATGQQKLVTISPLMEGVTNLIASTLLGAKFGAAGVTGEDTRWRHCRDDWSRLLQYAFHSDGNSLAHSRVYISAVGLPVLTAIPLIILAVHVWKGSPPSLLVFASAFTVTIFASTAIVLRTRVAKSAARRLNARN